MCSGMCCPPWAAPPPFTRPTPPNTAANASEDRHQLIAQLRRWIGDLSGSSSGLFSAYEALSGPRMSSSAWVVDGRFSASGKPLLANDLHLKLTAPSQLLLLHLVCPSYEAIGAAFAGTPFIISGHNRQIGWALDNSGADVQDLYVLSGVDEASYQLDGASRAFDVRAENIKVRGDAAVPIKIRTSVFGPVVTDLIDPRVYGARAPLALRWTAIDSAALPDTTANAFRALGNASDWTEFRAALAQYVAPSQNFLFASSTDIGYVLAGKVPIRTNPAHSGEFPVPGSSSTQYPWSGFIEADQMPRSLAPPEGFIVAANNRATPPNYPLRITEDWDAGSNGYRAKRIADRITALINARKLTVADMKTIQMDTTSELARDLRPLLVRLRLFAPSSPVAHTMFVWADVSSSRSTHPGRKALATGASKLGPGHVSWLAPCGDVCSMGGGTEQASRDRDWAAILAQLGISEDGVPKRRSELRWLFGRVRVSCCQIAVGCCIRAWYRQQALGSRDDLPQRGVTCLLQQLFFA